VVVSCEPVSPSQEDSETVVLRFEVRDTGIGIPPEKIPHLFDAFAQAEMSTTRRYGGTGLGLAICRQLVTALGGEIGVTSRVGGGSTFWFTARFLRAEAGGALTLPRHHVLRGRRALVVDDNASNRSILADVLREWDLEVEQTDDATAAVEVLGSAARQNNPVEVMLVDYLMPDQDGLALAKRVREDDQIPTPIMLLLLPSVQSADGRRLTEAGVRFSLSKPVNRSALFDALVEGLAERDGMRPTRAPASRHRSRSTGKHLLLVEDNEINQMVALGVLDHLGYTADVAADGVEAVEMALRKPYDAILMDVQMPRMDGYEATAYIRSQEPAGRRMPIIAMTAAALDTERDRSLAAGMDDFLAKPIAAERLEQTLRAWLLESPVRPIEEEPSPSPSPSSPEKLLDRSRVETLQRLGTRGATLAAAGIASFRDAAPKEVEDLWAALRDNDRERLGYLAHRLRGSAANLGAVAVAELSREIEETVDSGGIPEAWLLDRLEATVSETLPALTRLGDPSGPPTTG
jgi:two-component system, sensor histidine kinase and response regulator